MSGDEGRLPTLFIPHGGGPCFFMEWTMGPKDTWDRMAAYLRGIGGAVGTRPKAVLVISAHWEEDRPTVTAGAAPALGGDALGPPDAADGAAAELEALHLSELLREMAIVEPVIEGLEQLGHPVPDFDLQGAGGRAAPEAVEQAGRALGLVAALEAAELAHGDVQGVCPLAVRDLSRECRLHQPGSRQLLLAHEESLPCVHGGTFLLTS